MNTSELQKTLTDRLRVMVSPEEVIAEWDVARNSQDDYQRNLYCPKIDIAVGPYNLSREGAFGQSQILDFMTRHKPWFRKLFECSENNAHSTFNQFWEGLNPNPRCSIAIEIEKTGTRKHMLGDIINAGIIGRLGIVVPVGTEMKRAFVRIKQYIEFAYRVGKIRESLCSNVLIATPENILNIL